MRNLLLAADNDTALLIAVTLFIIAIGILLGTFLKGKFNFEQSNSSKFEGKVRVNVKVPFIHADSFKFYNALQRALPLEFIAFPNIGVDTIVKPAGNLIAYKAISGKYIDYCIFQKATMKPVAVIDLIDPRISTTPITRQSEAITKTLEAISMPVLEFVVAQDYNEKQILQRFLDSQDLYTLVELRKQREAKESRRR